MKHQSNILECWKTPRYIFSDGTVEVYRGYLISDQGRIASLKGKTMKFLKHHKGHSCYCKTMLRINGKIVNRDIHRVMLSTFQMNLWSKDNNEVDHINRDNTDNRLCNLRWTDQNGNDANRSFNPLKKIRVTYMVDGHVEIYNSMYDVSEAFGKSSHWCAMVILKNNGFSKKYNILIEKIK